MNLDSILKFFVPKDDSFFGLFEDDSRNLVLAAEQLNKLLVTIDREERKQINLKILELTKRGEEITINTYVQLNTSFITPFNREDIHELAQNLADVLNKIDHISKCINVYWPSSQDKFYSRLADSVYQSILSIDVCFNYLKDASTNKKAIIKACRDIRAYELKAREIFYFGISSLMEEEKNVNVLIKNKVLLENFERCIDRIATVSGTLKSILLKIQ